MGIHSIAPLQQIQMGSATRADLPTDLLPLLKKATPEFGRDLSASRATIAGAVSLAQTQIAGGKPEERRDTRSGGLAGWQERRLRAFIEAHFQERIRLETLAALANLSVSHFCRAFKQTIGVAPHAYLIRRRIGYAQRMMLATEKSIVEIANEAGFADQAHFGRTFQKMFHTSPGAWRRKQGAESREISPIDRVRHHGPSIGAAPPTGNAPCGALNEVGVEGVASALALKRGQAVADARQYLS